MKLLLDEQQSRRVAEILRREGYDVVALNERPRQQPLSDPDVLEAAFVERRAVVSENARDFTVLHRHWIERGRAHYGIVLTSSRRFPRRRHSPSPLLAALRTLLRANPAEDALRDQLLWLAP
ncbi:MAG: DUF5615 family PIN-like protein [Candidatus Limnocylindria bacterium]